MFWTNSKPKGFQMMYDTLLFIINTFYAFEL